LNTHNYFLHTLLIGGPIALFLLLLFLAKMGVDFYKRKSTAAVFFVVLLALNMLSENILFRHSGIFFVAVFMLFCYNQKQYSRENFSFRTSNQQQLKNDQ
jgi:O-antigen ligase